MQKNSLIVLDERIVEEWKQNSYLQYFCGFREYTPALTCHETELVKFRNKSVKMDLNLSLDAV